MPSRVTQSYRPRLPSTSYFRAFMDSLCLVAGGSDHRTTRSPPTSASSPLYSPDWHFPADGRILRCWPSPWSVSSWWPSSISNHFAHSSIRSPMAQHQLERFAHPHHPAHRRPRRSGDGHVGRGFWRRRTIAFVFAEFGIAAVVLVVLAGITLQSQIKGFDRTNSRNSFLWPVGTTAVGLLCSFSCGEASRLPPAANADTVSVGAGQPEWCSC